MKKRFKKIYIEITNKCNLNCSFCSIDNKCKRELTLDKFEHILTKINDYTDYVYLHVKGEPLLHSQLDGILKLCKKYNKNVNITTNGVLLKERLAILEHNKIRQINISLHSENNKPKYIEDILSTTDKLNSYIVFRFWALENGLDERAKTIIGKIINHYNLSPDYYDKIINEDNIKLTDKIYISKSGKFIWPNINNDYYEEDGFCYGLKDQIGILVDGTVTICCLDSSGISNLGNIFDHSLEDILQSDKVVKTISEFQKRKCYLDICKHCSYKEKFKKNKDILR